MADELVRFEKLDDKTGTILNKGVRHVREVRDEEKVAKELLEEVQEKEFEGPDLPPTPPQGVDAIEDKQLEQIVDMERAEKHSDLLRENADQE